MAAPLTLPRPRALSGLAPALLGASPVLLVLGYLVALAVSSPWERLVAGLGAVQPIAQAGRVLGLAVGATLWAALLAVPTAALVNLTDLPGRRLWRWLAPLPLAIPPYVGALVYLLVLAPGGLVHQALAALLQRPPYQVAFPSVIYSPAGAAFVLGLFTYPYLFLVVDSALQRLNPALEEAAISLGASRWQVFWRVTLPLLRPALLGGGLLIFMYGLVDFGVVALLRVQTFTTVIYTFLLAGFDLAAAAALSLVLVVLIWGVLLLQRRLLGQAAYTVVTGRLRPRSLTALGRWRWPALLVPLVPVGLGLVLPLTVLVWHALTLGGPVGLGLFLQRQLPYLRNSLLVAGLGATAALVLSAALAWWGLRRPGGWWLALALQAGYALPGTVLGLSLVGLSWRLFPFLYGTPWLLVVAYTILYSATAFQAVRATFAQIQPALEEAARSLGHSPLAAFWRVVVPLAWPGFVGGWTLAFIPAMRELAATLIIRPPGFDTLPVRVWVHMQDVGPTDPRGAAVALLLVLAIGLGWVGALSLRRPLTSDLP